MGSIYDDNSAIPGLISTAVQEVVSQAKALGISWTIRLATVVQATAATTSVIMDGDTATLSVSNLSSTSLLAGQRVYVLITPPSGNFIIGSSEPILLGNNCGTAGSMASGSTTSPNYVAQPGNPAVTLTKKFSNTSLRFSWAQTYYTTAPVNALFGLITPASGHQVFLGKHNVANGATNSHTPVSGVTGAAGIDAGTDTWIGAWAAAGGGGALTVDAGDFWTLCVEEYWPTG